MSQHFLAHKMMDLTLEATLAGHQNPIYTLAVDQENNLLYSAGNDKGIVEWDLETMQFKRVLCSIPSSVYALQLIPKTDLLAASLRSGGIYIIRRTDPALVAKLTVEQGAVFAIRVIAEKNEFIAVNESGQAFVWSLANFELLYTFKISNTTVRTVAYDLSHHILAFGDKNGYIFLYQASDYQMLYSRKVHEQTVSSLAFVGDTLISGGRDAKMKKLSLSNLAVVAEIVPHMFTVYAIVDLKDQNHFATVSRDKTIKIWNKDFKLVKNVSRDKGIDSHHLSINTAVYQLKSGLLCTAGDDKMVKIWKIS